MGYPIAAPEMRLNKVYFDLDQRMQLDDSITRETREIFEEVHIHRAHCML